MQEGKFREYLTETGHTKKSIDSRVRSLAKIEKLFHFDIDTIIFDREKVIKQLCDIKQLGIDAKNQNLSNAVRKYYTCMTKDEIGRIF